MIAALGGDDVVMGRGGNDIICLGAVAVTARTSCRNGADLTRGGPGTDLLLGGGLGPDLLNRRRRPRPRPGGGAGSDIRRADLLEELLMKTVRPRMGRP